MNYYPHHIGDHAKRAGHLSMLEQGALALLRDRYLDTEQPIPAGLVYRVCRARLPHERQAVDSVLAEFFSLEAGAWRSETYDAVIVAQGARADASRTNGQSGGRKKLMKSRPEQTCQDAARGLNQGPIANSVANATGSEAAEPPPWDDEPDELAAVRANPPAPPPPPPPPPAPPPIEAGLFGDEPPPPPTAQERVWACGVPLLTAAGVREAAARSMLGLWLRDHDADVVAAALADCAAEGAVQPVAWLQARLGVSVRRGARRVQREEPVWRQQQSARVRQILEEGAVALGLPPHGLMARTDPAPRPVITAEVYDAATRLLTGT